MLAGIAEGWIGLAVALGAGLLIGIERERGKGRGVTREPAGLRSFGIAATTGALAQGLPVPGLVIAGALLVGGLGTISHLKSRARDPGLTTELALFATYLIGVQAVLAPALGAALGVGLAALLAAREPLHRFATELITEGELRDGLVIASLALIVLPLIPPGPAAWLGGMAPRPLFAMVLLIMGLQASGQVALRRLGARGGAATAGLLAGFVSSTAMVASCGSRSRAHPRQAATLAASAALSGIATWIQAVVMTAALAGDAVAALAPAALGGVVGGLLAALPLLQAARAQPAPAPAPPGASALRPRAAVLIAAMLGAVALGVDAARRHFGDTGLLAGVALAALADSHAPISALAALHAGGHVTSARLVLGVLVAVAANTAMRIVIAGVSGGPRYALRVGAVLLASLAGAALMAVLA